MGKWWFNSMLSNEELEHRCGLGKSMDSLGRPVGNTSGSEDPILNDTNKNNHNYGWRESNSCSNVDHFSVSRTFGVSSLMTLF